MICELYLNKVIDKNHPKELQMKKLGSGRLNIKNDPTNGVKLGLVLDTYGHYSTVPVKAGSESPEAQSRSKARVFLSVTKILILAVR